MKTNIKESSAIRCGDRVTLNLQRGHIGTGTVIDPDFNAYYVLVKWDNENYNSDLSKLVSIKQKNAKFFPVPKTLTGAAVPKSKISLVERRQVIAKPDKELCDIKQTAEEVSFHRNLSRRFSNFGARETKNDQKISKSDECSRSTNEYNRLVTKIEEINNEMGTINFKEKSTLLSSEAVKKISETDRRGPRRISKSPKTSPAPSLAKKTLSSKITNKTAKEDTNRNGDSDAFSTVKLDKKPAVSKEFCTAGHLMVRKTVDTYRGYGVECDECHRKDIHKHKNGFFHCQDCGKVDLCNDCAQSNIVLFLLLFYKLQKVFPKKTSLLIVF